MKNIEILQFLDEKQIEKLKLSAQNYLRFARIQFSIVSYDNNELVVKIWQKENPTGKYLTSKELIERGKEVFSEIGQNIKVFFRPIPFKVDSLGNVDSNWVNDQLDKHGLQHKDLVKLLNIDKGSLSRLLSSDTMTKSSKAMFFYLFKYLELNRQ